jgi:hypothetical protein
MPILLIHAYLTYFHPMVHHRPPLGRSVLTCLVIYYWLMVTKIIYLPSLVCHTQCPALSLRLMFSRAKGAQKNVHGLQSGSAPVNL